MSERARLALAAASVALALALPALAQSRFPGSDADVRAAVCPARGSCRIDFVLAAGGHGATSLAVVRVRSGRLVCADEPAYRDELIAHDARGVRRVRTLVRGEAPCLEWERSSWRYEGGELLFEYGVMGAPTGYDTDTRRTTLHVRPWPLAITAAFLGSDPMAAPPTPARGPLVVLTME